MSMMIPLTFRGYCVMNGVNVLLDINYYCLEILTDEKT